MPHTETTDWLDKTRAGVIGVFRYRDGRELAAKIIGVMDSLNELVVEVVPAKAPFSEEEPKRQIISIDEVLSFDPLPEESQSSLRSDLCDPPIFSPGRFAALTIIFLGWIAGSMFLAILHLQGRLRLWEAAVVCYSLFQLFFTFARTRGFRPYSFSCPIVKRQVPRLLSFHLAFLAVLVSLLTIAFHVRPNLPAWWNVEDQKGATPFVVLVGLLCYSLAFGQLFINRSLLARAHKQARRHLTNE